MRGGRKVIIKPHRHEGIVGLFFFLFGGGIRCVESSVFLNFDCCRSLHCKW